MVEIDFPKDKSKLSKETQQQNTELGEKFAVQGYPTILLCDADGRADAATGYQEGGPERYLDHLNELRGKTKRDEALAAAARPKAWPSQGTGGGARCAWGSTTSVVAELRRR